MSLPDVLPPFLYRHSRFLLVPGHPLQGLLLLLLLTRRFYVGSTSNTLHVRVFFSSFCSFLSRCILPFTSPPSSRNLARPSPSPGSVSHAAKTDLSLHAA